MDARVEVEYPLIGLGTLLNEQVLDDELSFEGEFLDRRAATLSKLDIPTKIATFQLFDDGTHGDLYSGNNYWTASLPGIGGIDGMYKLRFILDMTVNGCTSRREMVQSIFVNIGVDPKATKTNILSELQDDGSRRTDVQILPVDVYGNLWGPGRMSMITCAAGSVCEFDQDTLIDLGGGSYGFSLVTPPNVASVRLNVFNGVFDLPIPCEKCPRLASIDIGAQNTTEHSSVTATLQLTEKLQTMMGAALWSTYRRTIHR